jgi:hypothetical protein
MELSLALASVSLLARRAVRARGQFCSASMNAVMPGNPVGPAAGWAMTTRIRSLFTSQRPVNPGTASAPVPPASASLSASAVRSAGGSWTLSSAEKVPSAGSRVMSASLKPSHRWVSGNHAL